MRKPPILPSPNQRKTSNLQGSPSAFLASRGSSSTSSPIHTPSKNSKLIFSRASPISPQLRDVALINRLNSKLSMESNSQSESMIPPSFSSSISLPGTFQNALKPVQSPVRKEIIEDGLVFKGADHTLTLWHASQHIDSWSENVKMWLAKNVFQALIARIDKLDSEFVKIGWTNLTCEAATFAESLNSSGQSNNSYNQQPQQPTTNTGSLFENSSFMGMGAAPKPPQKPNNLTQLQQFYGKEAIVVERMAIERYFASFDTNNADTRRQLIDRIRILGRGSGLAQFRWNSTFKIGDSSQHHFGRSNTSGATPSNVGVVGLTDAQLVMTLFCRYLDEKLPGEGYGVSPLHPFTSKYFVDASVSKTGKHALSGIKIRQSSKFPPHYQLMIDNVVHDVATGRNNVFDTVSLFLYQIKINYNGYLGMLSLAGKSIDLMKIVDTSSYSL